MSYVYAWEYFVEPRHADAFERGYGPDGEWVALFRRTAGYVRTVLRRDDAQPSRYVTLDEWDSRAAWELFRADFAAEFEAIDALGEEWTVREREIARFDGAGSIDVDTPPARLLVVYGTLAPGGANHARLDAYTGRWLAGRAQGVLHEAGWGAALGAPAMTLESGAGPVEVQVLESESLEGAWGELDAFEGEEYVRTLTPVETADRVLLANLYALRT